jgi:hypothetical protein
LQNFYFVRAIRALGLGTVVGMPLQDAIPAPPTEAADLPAIVRTLSYLNVRTIALETQMGISASKLRANVYKLLDEVIETGQPLEIERNGKTLVIAAKEQESIWDRLPRREGAIVGDPDELIHMDWSSEWNPGPD